MNNKKNESACSIEVLLPDGHTRSTLAIARSFSRRGISFIVLSDDIHCPACYSRFVKYFLFSPSVKKEPEAFFGFICKLIQKYGIQLIIPTSDATLLLLDWYRKFLPKQVNLAMANSQATQNVLNKRKNLKIAKKLEIPCPRQYELEKLQQLQDMIKFLGFPLVLKNSGETYGPNIPFFNFKVLYAHNEKELWEYIAQHCRTGIYPLFQEYAEGEVHNLCCFASKGKVIAIHQYKSIRRLGGEGVLRKIVDTTPELSKYTFDLLHELRWDGVAHVAFFIRKDQKKMWYMETNGRFWASTQGSVHAGWDFPYWVYNYFINGKKPEPGQIKIGSQTCWHYGDLRSLFRYLTGGESPTTGTWPSKIVATLQYLSGFNPIIHSDVFRWDDPLPFIRGHGKLFTQIWKEFKNRLK